MGKNYYHQGTRVISRFGKFNDGKLLWRLPRIGHTVGQPFSMDGSLLALEIALGTSSWVAVRETHFGAEVAPQVVGVCCFSGNLSR